MYPNPDTRGVISLFPLNYINGASTVYSGSLVISTLQTYRESNPAIYKFYVSGIFLINANNLFRNSVTCLEFSLSSIVHKPVSSNGTSRFFSAPHYNLDGRRNPLPISYSYVIFYAVLTGFEPAISAVTGRHPNQLNDNTIYLFYYIDRQLCFKDAWRL